MAPIDSPDRLTVGAPAFVLAYLAVLTLITAANNDWYPLLTTEFCGSLSDFHDGPVAAVCLGVVEYYARAAVHPPYAVVALLVSAAVAVGTTVAWTRRRT